jgi:hypothetical protein
MNNAQAEAFLRGFHSELEKDASFFRGLKVLGQRVGNVVKGGGAGGPTRGQLASKAWGTAQGIAKRNPYATAGLAGGAALGTGMAAGKMMG